jgi:hypothetical protein
VERDEKGRIKAGSGALHPGGKPKWETDLRDKLRDGTPAAFEFLARVMDGQEFGEEKPDIDQRMRAAEIWISYAIAKPKAEVGVEVSGESPFAGMTAEQLLEIARVKK